MGLIWTPKLVKPPLGTPLNKSDPICKNLILAMPMNENGGTSVLDAVGNLDGSFTGSPVWVDTLYGRGIKCNANNYILTNNPAWSLADFSIVTRILLDAVASDAYIIDSLDGNYALRFYCRQALNRVQLGAGNGTSIEYDYTTLTAEARWYTLGITRKSGLLTYYIDGKAVDTDTSTNLAVTNTGLSIGITGNASKSSTIDYLNVWNRALSSDEVVRLYRTPFCGYGRSIIELFSVSTIASSSSSSSPSGSPSGSPSISPSGSPSGSPSVSLSGSPSVSLSVSPSGSPSVSPSSSPSASPSPSSSPSPSGLVYPVISMNIFNSKIFEPIIIRG